jgi:23S rRNA pseudouridine1911/1915/1917 synthase
MDRLLFKNASCFVVNKLPGEASDPSGFGSFAEGELLPVHRLDMPVSGCLLFARNAEAAAFLGKAFASPAICGKQGQVKKLYWAIIEKSPAANSLAGSGELSHWLGVDKRTNKAFALAPDKAGNMPKSRHKGLKKAIFRYRVIGQGEHYLFLEIDLVTGRHHQIRAQLAAMGLHVKGDLKYGARRSEKAGGIRLHAHSLAFPNPARQDEIIRVVAEPPLMDALWSAFISADAL